MSCSGRLAEQVHRDLRDGKIDRPTAVRRLEDIETKYGLSRTQWNKMLDLAAPD